MREIIELVNQMSPYILLGFLLAGLMHAFVPNNIYRRYLGGSSFHMVVNAEKAIRGVEGVTDVAIDLASGKAIIHGSTDKEAVAKAVEAIGFSLTERA